MTKLSTQSYKGARDWYPEDMRLRSYVFDTWRAVMRQYGYEAYDAPILEPVEIYEAKSGRELVSEQSYQLTDRGDRRVMIRPEMTPSVSRMIAARRQETPLPARWYSIAQFMRYERPQRGREREFWQLNCDLFGDDSVRAEAEIIEIADSLMKRFGATPEMYKIRINNRQIVNFMMASYLGLDSGQASLMIKLFDRRGKITPEAFRTQASDIFGRDQAETGLRKVTQLLAARSMADLPEEIRDSDAVGDIQELFTAIERAGVATATFDISLMRGLDYYTGMVFEVFDTHPENSRSLFGGGRYDGLVGMFGVEPLSAVGFAPGLSTTLLFLESHGLVPELASTTDAYIVVIGADAERGALRLARELRSSGLNIEVGDPSRKPDKQIKVADRKSIRHAIFVGTSELETGEFTLKNLATGDEQSYDPSELVSTLQKR